MSNDLEARVKNWLERHGYPLEMKVAQALQKAGFGEQLNVGGFYQDSHTGKYREADVEAYCIKSGMKDGSSTIFTLVCSILVECKKSQNPWIAFVVDDSPMNANQMGSVYNWPMTEVARKRIADQLMFKWEEVGSQVFTPGPTAYGLAESKLGKEDGEKSQEKKPTGNVPNRAYEAMLQLLDALEARVKNANEVESASNLPNHKRGMVWVPVLILDGPLFECRLSDGELTLTAVKRTTVVLRDRMVGFGVPRILVVTADELAEFARSAFALGSQICDAAQWWVDHIGEPE